MKINVRTIATLSDSFEQEDDFSPMAFAHIRQMVLPLLVAMEMVHYVIYFFFFRAAYRSVWMAVGCEPIF